MSLETDNKKMVDELTNHIVDMVGEKGYNFEVKTFDDNVKYMFYDFGSLGKLKMKMVEQLPLREGEPLFWCNMQWLDKCDDRHFDILGVKNKFSHKWNLSDDNYITFENDLLERFYKIFELLENES